MEIEPINFVETVNNTMPYAPDQSCFDWCIVQHVVHSNNMELNAVMIVVFAFISLIIYYVFGSFDKTKAYKDQFIYYAKLLLTLFLGYYILSIRMGLF